jgi:hypothetical protein
MEQKEPKPIHEQIIDAVGGEDRFREIAGLKPKQETLEEALPKNSDGKYSRNEIEKAFELGAKWQAEQMEKLKEFDEWKEWKNK